MSAVRDIRSLFADYASYHRTSGNKAFHRISIPLIMLSLLGMLARPVRVGPPDHGHRQPVGHPVGPAQQVPAGLGGGVGAVRQGRVVFRERAVANGPVHLVRGDVQHRPPGPTARLQHHLRPQHVGAHERPGVLDAPIHERLGGRVHHPVGRNHQRRHGGGIGHVALHEPEPRVVAVGLQVGQVPRVGKPVQHRHQPPGPLQQEVHQVRADEPGAPGHQDVRGPARRAGARGHGRLT